MASPHERASDSPADGPTPEITPRRLREQSQLDFELGFFGRILDRDPFFADALRVHAQNLARKRESSKALELDLRLVRLTPEDEIAWYNLACSYAVLGMIEPAFATLQRALELGYRSLRLLRRDPDLKSLRSDPRFVDLLTRFEFIV